MANYLSSGQQESIENNQVWKMNNTNIGEDRKHGKPTQQVFDTTPS
jgi:hypothetical protein